MISMFSTHKSTTRGDSLFFLLFLIIRKYKSGDLSQEEIDTKQNRFLKLWKRMLRKANFKQLSEKEVLSLLVLMPLRLWL
jgi:hypothetical protein